MKKIFCLLLVLVLMFGIVGCGATSSVETEDTKKASAVDSKTENTSVKNEDETKRLFSGIYYVGTDIEPGQYILKSLESDYSMDILLFETGEKYDGYLAAPKTTLGEESQAINGFCLHSSYIEHDEEYYLNLKDGNVLSLDDGSGELRKIVKGGWAEDDIRPRGVYYCPDDIDAGSHDITCAYGDYSLDIKVFKSLSVYDEYLVSPRSTLGEESEAVDKYADFVDYLDSGESCHINVQEGGILVIDDNGFYLDSPDSYVEPTEES
jgi:predicted small lipoprotein YifL